MKSYTDIEQSKKLTEILQKESADMRYSPLGDNMHPWVLTDTFIEKDAIPCWSLAALLEIIPKQIGRYQKTLYWFDDAWHCEYVDEDSEGKYGVTADNSVNACYEMIIKLKENNLL